MEKITQFNYPIKASLITYKNSLNNKIFDVERRDNNANKFIYLRDKLRENNINLQTYDINLPKDSLLSIHFDVHKDILLEKRSPINILIARESPIINKENHLRKYLNKFDLTLTWNKDLCDQNKILWSGYGNSVRLLETDVKKILSKKNKDLCSIIGKKYSNNRYSLYRESEKSIRFFTNSDLDFDLYGYGWDKRQFKGILRPINKIPYLRDFLYKPYNSYKGSVKSKADIFRKYKFSLCFENCSSNGYITEKIFDSMFSGCIPIYLGCPNIKNEIDPDTFIDFRDFSNYKDLYFYIKKMPENDYLFKLNKIKEFYDLFLNTTYCDQVWASDLVNNCLKLINKN